MTVWLNDPHKNFIGDLVFLLKFPSNLAPFSQSLSLSIGSPDTTLTFEYFCAGVGFSSDIVIRRKCYSLEMQRREDVRENEMRTEKHRIEEMRTE